MNIKESVTKAALSTAMNYISGIAIDKNVET